MRSAASVRLPRRQRGVGFDQFLVKASWSARGAVCCAVAGAATSSADDSKADA